MFLPLVFGCATSKTIKQEYRKNKQGNWNASGEVKSIGESAGKDLYSIFILPFKNIFTGKVFKEYPY